MTTLVAYKFRGIQHYIARGGQLLEIAGGSEALDSLTRTALAKAFELLEVGGVSDGEGAEAGLADLLPDKGKVLQAASGMVLILFNADSDAKRFVRFWPMLAEQWAPLGRHAIDAYAFTPDEIDTAGVKNEALSKAVTDARLRVQQGPDLPMANHPSACPVTLRANRTGLPVVEFVSRQGEQPEDCDASTSRRRRLMSDRRIFVQTAGLPGLKQRFGFDPEERLSREADALASAAGGSVLAIVHADGSGFGARFKALTAAYGPEAVTQFARLLRGIMQDAATKAAEPMHEVWTRADLEPDKESKIAFRPILLGGDDLTFLVPAVWGLPLARAFLEALEAISFERLRDFSQTWPIKNDGRWQSLHAAAGIAYVHAHYPFELGLRIAEGVAGWVKARLRDVENKTSGLAFHRAFDTASSDFEAIFAEQYTVQQSGDASKELTGAPYVTKAIDGANWITLPQLEALLDIADMLPRGGWREVARLVREKDPNAAELRMKRIFEVLSDKATTDAVGKELRTTLQNIGGTLESGLIWSTGPIGARRTPVQDVDILLALKQRSDHTEPEADHAAD